MAKQNWFNTLAEALESENLSDMWMERFPFGEKFLTYGESFGAHFEDGTKYGHFISMYRDERGMYERPVHYSCG